MVKVEERGRSATSARTTFSRSTEMVEGQCLTARDKRGWQRPTVIHLDSSERTSSTWTAPSTSVMTYFPGRSG